MAKILKVKLDKKQKSHDSWLVTTIKKLIYRPVKDHKLPIFSSRQTQETDLHNRNILAAFNGNLGETIKYQNGSPIDYAKFSKN